MMAAFGAGLLEGLEGDLEELLLENVLVEGRPFATREDGE